MKRQLNAGTGLTRRHILLTALPGLLCAPVLAQSSLIAPPTPSEQVQAALGELDKQALRALQESGVPGMVIAVVHKGKVVYLKGFGVREAGKPEPVTPDTVFQLASLSKPIASTIIASLVGEGRISWDDPIVRYLPEFQMASPDVTRSVTIRDMLSHRSGLPEHIGDLLEDMGYSQEEILHRLRYVDIENRFRANYAYTNFGFTAAGVAAAKAAGSVWEDLAAERLYRPLGMTSTSSRFSDYMAARDRAKPHVQENGKWIARYQRQPDAQSPAGGVSSSIRDLAQWFRLQLGDGKVDGKQIVDAPALAETHRAQMLLPAPQADSYGLGWNVRVDNRGRLRLGHSGAFNLGAATTAYLIPSESLGIVVLTNAAPVGVAEAVALSFLDMALEGKIERDWRLFLEPIFAAANAPLYGTSVDYTKPPAQPSPALPLEAYVGTYRNDFFGEIEVARQDSGLVLKQGPKKNSLPMRHWDRDVFLYQPAGESAGGLSGVTFTISPDRKAQQVVIEDLNIHGLGAFVRRPTGK